MATMKDVATRAGVSGATVSHVLNGTRHVTAETRERVEEAIRVTGYRHNSLARALAAGRTQTIGLCVPILTNPYIADLVNAIETAAGIEGYTLLLGDSQDETAPEERAVQVFLERRVDGIIMAPSSESAATTIPQILSAGIPLVLIDRPMPDVACDQVFAENFESARRLTEHMLSHGHRDLVVLCGQPGIRSTDERLKGFLRAIEERPDSDDIAWTSVMGMSNAGATTAALGELLSTGRRPDAVISLNNAMTIGAMRAFKDAVLDVPGDIALGSFDDFEWSDLFSPRITAISQDVSGMGRTAVRLLISRMSDADQDPNVVSLPTALNVRDSCGGHDG
jgi:LacI family transcriptional regulator